MAKSIKVNIGGLDYSLTGEDEELIVKAAEKVNEKINNLQKSNNDLPINTITVLTALNLAEEKIIVEKVSDHDMNNLSVELSKIISYMENKLKD